jgi:uncharacterized protein YsxB (DUF464 family)
VIRIYAIVDTLDTNGGTTIVLTGHANEKVCAGVSAVVHTALLGLEAIAKNYPRQASFKKTLAKKTSRA